MKLAGAVQLLTYIQSVELYTGSLVVIQGNLVDKITYEKYQKSCWKLQFTPL